MKKKLFITCILFSLNVLSNSNPSEESLRKVFSLATYSKTGVHKVRGRLDSVLNRNIFDQSSTLRVSQSILKNSPIRMSLSTNANNWIIRQTSVLFPIKGIVKFSVRKENGNLRPFKKLNYDSGELEEVYLDETNLKAYLVETEAAYQDRLVNPDNVTTNRFIGEIGYSFNGIGSILFYEITNENELIEAGAFVSNDSVY